MISFAFWLLPLVAAPVFASSAWITSLPEAVAASKDKKLPILVDFQAPWCYSCYYMEQRVLSKPGFAAAAKKLVPLKLDVDTSEGAAAKAKHAVTFLPTYVLLSPGGDKEIGRIIGEQTEADFLAKLEALLGGKAIDDAEHEALRRKIAGGDLKVLSTLLEKPADCRTPYAVFKAEKHVENLPGDRKAVILAAEKKSLESLASARLFVPAASRCADFRSGVEALAAVYEKLGDAAAREALLARAVEQLEKDGKAGDDRNRDDDLRYFLELKKDDGKLRTLYPVLVAAYPSDYVYAHRYAKYLLGRGEPAAALPWSEKADRLAYGANRLYVTAVRAKILAALGRKDEARKLLERDIKAGKAVFPKEAAPLQEQLASLK